MSQKMNLDKLRSIRDTVEQAELSIDETEVCNRYECGGPADCDGTMIVIWMGSKTMQGRMTPNNARTIVWLFAR